MKRWNRLFRSASVTRKFVATYLSIVALSLAGCGIYMYLQISASAVAQAQSVMEQNLVQTKDSIMDKVNMVQNISSLIRSDLRLQTFLGSPFNREEAAQYEEFRSNITPFVDNVLRQNPYMHALRVFMTNATIPEVYDSFYRLDRIEGEAWAKEAIEHPDRDGGWRELSRERIILETPQTTEPADVFAFYQPIDSIRYYDMVGIMEIEMEESELFDVLRSPNLATFGQVYAVDEQGVVVSANNPDSYKRKLEGVDTELLPEAEIYNEVMTVGDRRSVVISVPVPEMKLRIVGVFAVSGLNGSLRGTAVSIAGVLLLALLLFGFIVYLITLGLLARLKALVRAMKQVREGSLTVSLPVKSNDEFSQIAISFNMMTRRIHELVETVYKIQLLEREAELKALESQVNPHFLYNTLATISWVARKVKSAEIVHLTEALAKFYRLVLSKGKREILVKDEIAMVRAYLDVQKFRFEDKFNVVYDIDERVYEHCVVKNILQPLTENALLHGIEPKRSPGTLIVRAGIEDSRLFFAVIDDGVGMSRERLEELRQGKVKHTGGSGSGYAFHNIMERLKAYYGGGYRLDIFSRPGIGTAVRIELDTERS